MGERCPQSPGNACPARRVPRIGNDIELVVLDALLDRFGELLRAPCRRRGSPGSEAIDCAFLDVAALGRTAPGAASLASAMFDLILAGQTTDTPMSYCASPMR